MTLYQTSWNKAMLNLNNSTDMASYGGPPSPETNANTQQTNIERTPTTQVNNPNINKSHTACLKFFDFQIIWKYTHSW